LRRDRLIIQMTMPTTISAITMMPTIQPHGVWLSVLATAVPLRRMTITLPLPVLVVVVVDGTVVVVAGTVVVVAGTVVVVAGVAGGRVVPGKEPEVCGGTAEVEGLPLSGAVVVAEAVGGKAAPATQAANVPANPTTASHATRRPSRCLLPPTSPVPREEWGGRAAVEGTAGFKGGCRCATTSSSLAAGFCSILVTTSVVASRAVSTPELGALLFAARQSCW